MIKALPAVSPVRPKPIKLALQGGGAHGAFTWGVLDAILEDPRLTIEAIAGASAGAMNAVVLADGLCEGGPARARAQLADFWKSASLDGALPAPARHVFDLVLTAWGLNGAERANPLMDWLTRTSSPYAFNPLNINPLTDILDRLIDFPRLREKSPIRLYIGATNVETGKPHVFTNAELTARHIAASACLPQLFQAVEIDNAYFWDGGYTGNPPLYPLFAGEARDLLLVQINPIHRKGAPRRPGDIQQRLNEISFNAPLLHELRAIDFVARLLDTGVLDDPHYKRMLMHRIALSETSKVSAASKLNTEFAFFLTLMKAGRRAARAWLAKNFDALGQHDTFDLKKEFG